MRIFTKTQLGLIFFAIACFMGVATSLIVNYLVSNQIIYEAQERVKEDLNVARWVYMSRLKDIDRTVRWAAVRHVLKDAIRKRDVTAIRGEFLEVMEEERLDFITVVDAKGAVITRFHNPNVSGDSLVHDPFVRRGLEKKATFGTQIVPREDLLKEGEELARRAAIRLIPTPKEKLTEKAEETLGMLLKSAHPVYDFDGKVMGVLVGGVLLNRNYEIVDQIKNIVFKDAKYKGKEIGTATIFMGDIRISTNVVDKEGNRAIGTRVMKEVYGQVFEKGIPWTQRAFVVDDWYITAYEPIQDIQNKIVGMLYVGMLESKYALMKERLILLFFLFSMSGMLISLGISFWFSWAILKKKAQ